MSLYYQCFLVRWERLAYVSSVYTASDPLLPHHLQWGSLGTQLTSPKQTKHLLYQFSFACKNKPCIVITLTLSWVAYHSFSLVSVGYRGLKKNLKVLGHTV